MEYSKDGGVQIRVEVAINASVIIHQRNFKSDEATKGIDDEK